jgi:Fe-S-cluster-containing dehydrogenase component/CRP-like cAMP-binding protein
MAMPAVTVAERPKRWDRPFDPDMQGADIDVVLQHNIFRDIDSTQFSEALPLREIIRNDSRLLRFKRGDVVVREGDYGNSMFAIISGQVRVVLDEVTNRELGRREGAGRRSFFQSLRQLWSNPDQPEVRDLAAYRQAGSAVGLRSDAEVFQTYIADLDSFLSRHETVELVAGQSFGEIAALARTPRTATVVAADDLWVVELRWQGMRDIRRRDAGFRQHIDGDYRSRNLAQHLAESPLFAALDETALASLAQQVAFETYGAFEWYQDFKQVRGGDPVTAIAREPVIAEEGHYLDGLIMIRSGFSRISERQDSGHRTIGYATQNDVFGLREIIAHHRGEGELVYEHSLRAVGHVDVLRVPTAFIEHYVLPVLSEEMLRTLHGGAVSSATDTAVSHISQSLAEFLLDHRTINGTATMLIDTDRCTSCDDCVRACAATHSNNPRFRRHGPVHEGIQVTNACMHCVDPVCMIGCPTGAIHRHRNGPVIIDDATCIGCGTCAASCPYDNISLVDIRDRSGLFVIDEQTRQPIVKATKCDLCFDQLGGPACQRACPHDALVRMNMQQPRALADWINRK